MAAYLTKKDLSPPAFEDREDVSKDLRGIHMNKNIHRIPALLYISCDSTAEVLAFI